MFFFAASETAERMSECTENARCAKRRWKKREIRDVRNIHLVVKLKQTHSAVSTLMGLSEAGTAGFKFGEGDAQCWLCGSLSSFFILHSFLSSFKASYRHSWRTWKSSFCLDSMLVDQAEVLVIQQPAVVKSIIWNPCCSKNSNICFRIQHFDTGNSFMTFISRVLVSWSVMWATLFPMSAVNWTPRWSVVWRRWRGDWRSMWTVASMLWSRSWREPCWGFCPSSPSTRDPRAA